MADLYRRTGVERDGLEALVKAGFLDGLASRGGRLRLLAEIRRLPAKRRGGQRELPLPHPASWWASREDLPEEYLPPNADQRGKMEWEALSLNVRRHPLAPYRAALERLGVVPSREIPGMRHGSRVRAAGLLECLQRPPTKSGSSVYFLLVEDEAGLLQCAIFEDAYRKWGHVLHHAGAFLLDGRVEQDDRRGFSFLVNRVQELGPVLADFTVERRTRIPEPRAVPSSGSFVRAERRGKRAG